MAINNSNKTVAKSKPRMKNIKSKTRSLDDKQVEKVIKSYEKDKEAGLYELALSGRFTKLTKYLFDPYSQLKFRKCKDLYVEDEVLYFVTREGRHYHCSYIFNNNKSRIMYKMYDENNMLEAFFSQDEVMNWLKDNVEF